MGNIYTVTFYDNYGDEHSDALIAIWLDPETALDYAARYHLEHEETIIVEKREEGVQHAFKNIVIYERKHYDHTEALFSTVCWYDCGVTLSQNQVIAEAVRQASPLITQEVDFDKLYQLYMETWMYEEE